MLRGRDRGIYLNYYGAMNNGWNQIFHKAKTLHHSCPVFCTLQVPPNVPHIQNYLWPESMQSVPQFFLLDKYFPEILTTRLQTKS